MQSVELRGVRRGLYYNITKVLLQGQKRIFIKLDMQVSTACFAC